MKKLVSMFEIMIWSMDEWMKDMYKWVQFGKVVVLIADREANQVAMTVQNALPMPRLITFKEDFDSEFKKLTKVLEDQSFIIATIEKSLYE